MALKPFNNVVVDTLCLDTVYGVFEEVMENYKRSGFANSKSGAYGYSTKLQRLRAA